VSPTVNSYTPTDTEVTLAGTILDDNGSSIITYGFIWSLDHTINTSLSTKTSYGFTLPNPFGGVISGLTPSTVYYFKAYATNAYGTSYSNEGTFTTEAIPIPNLVPSYFYDIVDPRNITFTVTPLDGSGNYNLYFSNNLDPDPHADWSASDLGINHTPSGIGSSTVNYAGNGSSGLNVNIQAVLSDNITLQVKYGKINTYWNGSAVASGGVTWSDTRWFADTDSNESLAGDQ